MRLHDTLTGATSELVPRDEGKVGIYACGPTVYDEPHLGHARSALTYDVLRRYLRWVGFEVRLVANITDIDDNIIKRAAEQDTTEPELAAHMEAVYVELMRRLDIEDPDERPHATQYVDQMQAVIAELIDRDAAYVIDGSGVYFDVSAFPGYGALVHRTPDDLRAGAGARVEVDEQKDDPLDFALWKAAKAGEPTWDSPWGPGRPGWHIECAAMALDLLGERFDIHGGGTDLAFPHHENERAEAEAAGHRFAGHWVHNAMLNIGGEKMSKSLGNFETLRSALDVYDPRALRLAFLQAHYRSVIELGADAMAGATGGISRLDAFFRRLGAAGAEIEPEGALDGEAVERFRTAMDDDLATPDALAVVFDLVSAGNSSLDAGDAAAASTTASTARHLLDVLGIGEPATTTITPGAGDGAIEALMAERHAARQARDFATADRIRDQLHAEGIEIEDTAAGAIWRRGLSPGVDIVDRFLGQYARTQRFTRGAPRTFRVADDGSRVAFVRSRSGTDPINCLWVLDVESGIEQMVLDPRDVLAETGETGFPAAERARRERLRESGGGVVSYDADADLTVAVAPLDGRLFVADLIDGAVHELPASAGAFDPRLDPTGQRVAYVAGAALRVTEISGADRLVIEGEGTVSWGSTEFLAGEEMGRTRGHWWAPGGTSLLVERVDVAPVETWHIASPVDPGSAPREIRYPRAGTANAEVGMAIVGLDGSRVDIDWSTGGFEYLASAAWAPREHPTLTVQTRDQRTLAILDVDPETGSTTEVDRLDDAHWVELVPGAPRWANGSLLTVADHGGARRLMRDGQPVTPPDLQVRSVIDANDSHALVVATPDPTEAHLYRVGFDGVINQVTFGAGVHGAVAGGGTIVETARSLDWAGARVRVLRDGDEIATIASNAENPVLTPSVELLVLGERRLHAALVLPGDHDGSPLPVLVDPYGGPHALRVQHASDVFLVPQWFAENGFAVLVVDGRGTPARGPEWERAVAGDLAGPVLDDQVDALQAAAARGPELDLTRVAIRGWSFGGYLAALAVLRRPDVFHAAIAGAPVTDWRLYDTHYTERYLGHPDTDATAYEQCELINEAASLTRPLLLVHGLADDNVVAAHTLRLSRALLEAGRPHRVLPLSGVTHMTPQEVVAENLLRLQLDFLRECLAAHGE